MLWALGLGQHTSNTALLLYLCYNYYLRIHIHYYTVHKCNTMTIVHQLMIQCRCGLWWVKNYIKAITSECVKQSMGVINHFIIFIHATCNSNRISLENSRLIRVCLNSQPITTTCMLFTTNMSWFAPTAMCDSIIKISITCKCFIFFKIISKS